MKLYVPDYYPAFHCIADKCKHTCCAGWEIDIDDESLARYEALPGAFGARVRNGISRDGIPHFILDEKERCPLLNRDKLCDLIIEEGEDALCQICRDHPRFRNFFTDRVEMGLGLVCEEAVRLILSSDHPLRLICMEDDGEDEPLTEDETYLLHLREAWLNSLPEEGPRTRLMETLIYRHLALALEDGLLEERIDFIQRAYRHIADGWQDGEIETLVERARFFSDCVEYDDEALEQWIEGNEPLPNR